MSGAISGIISSLGDVAIAVVKFLAISAVCAIFMLAINVFLTYITNLVFTSVVGEVLAIMSACLPFNALAVFGAIGTATNLVLTFLIAKKIFDMVSWSISTI